LRADSYVFQTATPVEGRLMAIQSLYTTFVGLNLIFYAKDHSIGRGILKKMILIPEDMLPISFGTLQTLEGNLEDMLPISFGTLQALEGTLEDMLPISFGTLQTLEGTLEDMLLISFGTLQTKKKSRELDSRFDS